MHSASLHGCRCVILLLVCVLTRRQHGEHQHSRTDERTDSSADLVLLREDIEESLEESSAEGALSRSVVDRAVAIGKVANVARGSGARKLHAASRGGSGRSSGQQTSEGLHGGGEGKRRGRGNGSRA